MDSEKEAAAATKLAKLLDRNTDPFEYDVVEQALRAGSTATEKWRSLHQGAAARALRERVNLTQRQLGLLSGLPHSKIAQVEQGQDVRLSTLRRYYAGCGLELLLLPRGPASALAMYDRVIGLIREGIIDGRRRYPRH